MTHKFGRDFGLGTTSWIENPSRPGHYLGNPSTAPLLSEYMISLRRRKVRSNQLTSTTTNYGQARRGEVVTSARAMNEDVMRQLYLFNNNPNLVPRDLPLTPTSRKRKAEDTASWGGYRLRTMLHCLYVISMLCLLRYDEALHIRWDDITMGINSAGDPFIQLNLLVRKTHQNGGE